MSGKFSRMDLRNSTIADGRGGVSLGTYGWLFAELVKEGAIKELVKSVGNVRGVYCKPDEYEKLKTELAEVSGTFPI